VLAIAGLHGIEVTPGVFGRLRILEGYELRRWRKEE
jgi:hypothetical protein